MKSTLLLIIGMIFLSMMFAGCSTTTDISMTANISGSDAESEVREINIDKLEIYHFHGTNQCYSCVTIGDYAEETVNTYFSEELESGLIVFDHINGELPQNEELVVKYGATGSSLWLGSYDGENFVAEQNVQVWYKIKDKQDYMNYLKGVIEQKLAGN